MRQDDKINGIVVDSPETAALKYQDRRGLRADLRSRTMKMADWADFAGYETFAAGLKASLGDTFGTHVLADYNDHHPRVTGRSKFFSCLSVNSSNVCSLAGSTSQLPDQV